MNRFYRRVLPLAAVVMAVPVLTNMSASAVIDTTPPTLNLPAHGSFVPLETISATTMDEFGQWPLETDSIDMRTQWTASDASGICGYRTRSVYDDSKGAWSSWSNRTSATLETDDYDDQEGGGVDQFWGLDVRARDCAGNATTKFVRFAPMVFQEDGQSYRWGTLNVSTSGPWTQTRCACWSAGTALKTSTSGARINFPLSANDLGSTVTFPVALVMERARDRGRASVLIDGVRVATIDTYSATKVHRSVVWVGRIEAGTHEVSVVNMATPGRPRIDVDALLANPMYNIG